MASGTFTTGTLSLSDIRDKAFPGCSGSLRNVIADSTYMSLPASINDFKGRDYCQISTNPYELCVGRSCKLDADVQLFMIPHTEVRLLSQPSWTWTTVFNNDNCVQIKACSSGYQRDGFVCFYDQNNNFPDQAFLVCQF